jgi:hypothetical protein
VMILDAMALDPSEIFYKIKNIEVISASFR